jgi:hypothetical protein
MAEEIIHALDYDYGQFKLSKNLIISAALRAKENSMRWRQPSPLQPAVCASASLYRKTTIVLHYAFGS